MKIFAVLLFKVLLLALTSLDSVVYADETDGAAKCIEDLLRLPHLRDLTVLAVNQSLGHGRSRGLAMAQSMMDLMRQFTEQNLRFDFFETFFRRNSVRYYLVAQPAVLKPPQFKISLPSVLDLGEDRLTHWLWTGVNGEEEAATLKSSLLLTDKQNLQFLRSTGLLTLPKRPLSTPN